MARVYRLDFCAYGSGAPDRKGHQRDASVSNVQIACFFKLAKASHRVFRWLLGVVKMERCNERQIKNAIMPKA